MEVGDLIRDKEFPEDGCGLILRKGSGSEWRMTFYLVLQPNGKTDWFKPEYIENECEVVSSASGRFGKTES